MSPSPPHISSEEQEQILQTIEMFEVIIQASPQDCQSMEILRDAYVRLGRGAEALSISRKLADTYVAQEQYSQATLEYESILQKDPGNGDVIAALGNLEEKLRGRPQIVGGSQDRSTGHWNAPLPSGSLGASAIDLDFQMTLGDGGILITTEQTVDAARLDAPRLLTPEEARATEDGNAALAKFLIQHRLAPEEIVNSALERVTKKNAARPENALPAALIDEICRRGSIELEVLYSGIIDRSKFAYIPLEYYDVDRSIVKMLPEHLTVGRLIVPFDLMSRTVMIATANPFDASAKETAQQLLDYNIQWHLAAPSAITAALAATYKVASAGPETISFRLAS